MATCMLRLEKCITNALHMIVYTPMYMLTAYTNPMNYDVRRDFLPHISPRLLYSLLTSSIDNLIMSHL
jgi:hypothetical protein